MHLHCTASFPPAACVAPCQSKDRGRGHRRPCHNIHSPALPSLRPQCSAIALYALCRTACACMPKKLQISIRGCALSQITHTPNKYAHPSEGCLLLHTDFPVQLDISSWRTIAICLTNNPQFIRCATVPALAYSCALAVYGQARGTRACTIRESQ